MSSGISVDDKCVEQFEEMKMNKTMRYITFKLTSDNKSVVPDEIGPIEKTFDDFVAVLNVARDNGEGRWGIVDFPFQNKDGVNTSKLMMVQWIHMGNCKVKTKMMMASTWDALKKKFVGVHKCIEATDDDEIEYNAFLQACQSKK